MKILLVTNAFPTEQNPNLCSYILDFASAVKDCGCEIKVASIMPKANKSLSKIIGRLGNYTSVPKCYEMSGVPVITIQSVVLFVLRLFKKMPRVTLFVYEKYCSNKLKLIINEFKPDILYASDPLQAGKLVRILGKQLGIQYCTIEHSITNIRFAGNARYLRKVYQKTENDALVSFFVSTVQSNIFRSEIRTGQCNIAVVSNGYNNEEFLPNTKIIKDLEVRKNVITTVGFVAERKGYFYLLDALKILKDEGIKFTWCVVGNGSKLEDLINDINNYGMNDRVVITGQVSHSDVMNYLSGSDIFCLPSYDEPFGIVYLEAMSMGIPIIGTLNEGISDIIEDGKSGFLIKKGDVLALSQLIKRLLTDKEYASSVGKCGKDIAESTTWRKNASDTIGYIKCALEVDGK